jgi:hypothetical protein
MQSNKVIKLIIQKKISELIVEIGSNELQKEVWVAELDEIFNLIKDIK